VRVQLVVDVPLGPPLQRLLERDAAFEARERGTETEVEAVPEAEVVAGLSVDVERVSVREATVVAVPRSVEQHHHAALADRASVHFDVA